MQQQPRPAARLARLTTFTVAAAAMAGCAGADSTGVPSEPTPTRMTLRASPAAASVLIGATTQLTAEVHDAHGRRMRSVIVTWRSLDPDVAEVSRGLAAGSAAGVARVVASVGDVADTVLVDVTADPTAPGVVASLSLTPATVSVHEGATAALTAVARDSHGATVSGASVSWKSTDPGVATVSAKGVVTGVGAGTAKVIAAASGFADTVEVTVTPVPVASVTVTAPFGTLVRGDSGQLAVVVRAAAGDTLTSRETTFRTSSPAVATVSATGVVTAVGVGTATITATSGGKSGTVAVRVTAPEVVVGAVDVSPAAVTLDPGQTRQLAATVRDAGGEAIADRTVTWASANAGVASVSATGVVTGVAAGSTTVTATSGGKSAAVTVTVTSAPPPPPPPEPVVGSVTVSPTAVMLDPGQTRQLAATVRSTGGAVLAGQPVTWTSANASVATVSASGLVTATGPGTATVTATSGGQSAVATITVTAPPVPTEPVDVEAPLVAVGTVAQFDGAQFYLPDVLVAGDDDSTGVAPMQGFVTYSLSGVPVGAPVERALLTVEMHPSGVFGEPFSLGPLIVERVTQIALATGAPASSAVTVATSLGGAVTVDVTELVRAELAAGGRDVTLRIRFTTARDADGATDQLELTAGELEVRYLK